ncbi:MAG TPA: GMC family oxidoreductase N-terminal domain-containing protein [Solirubrobacteraceae bacterium]|nr:GMC family oxidoreductase N-terminal domain-containing protein [Solirubrobacteraceae bacterium]
MSQGFDYIVVGAGSAGCVLADRLTEDLVTRVLLIEAGGPDRSPNIKIPAAFAKQFHTKLDWNFSTEPEPHVDGRSLYIPRGKSLGGSSSMNAMLYVRGRPLDYDLWEAQGAEGWGWRDVQPYFLKSEDDARGASEFHGAGGPLRVSNQRSPRAAVDRRLIAASEAAGIPRSLDYNGPEQDGVAMFQVNQRDGRRWSAADAFLRPALKRPNLEVMTRTRVLRVEFEGDRAVGVRIARRRGGERSIRAGREVILSAGAIQSPQLLLLSGIGSADDLRAVGVEPRRNLPGVGRNLQDHPFVTLIWEVSEQNTLYGADKPKPLAEWVLRRTGPLTSTVAEVVAFVRTRPGLQSADVQFHMGAAYYEDHGAETYDGHCVVIAPVLISPQARGQVWLRSADPTEQPRIITNSLSEPDDLRSLVDGMQLAREIAAQGPMREIILSELKPGPDQRGRTDLEADLRRRLMLIYHPVGTCRMSDAGDDAVVDSRLRVHGLKCLRVVDASVMPIIPGGNTNAPTIMIAERAADLIRGRVPESATAPQAG